MNNICEKREIICINCPDFKISSLYSLQSNQTLDCTMDGKFSKLPLITSLDSMHYKYSPINNLNYMFYNDFDKTFIELYNPMNRKTFVHQIQNNTLSLPFEMKAVITIIDLNIDVTFCFIPISFENSWFDFADGVSLMQVDIKMYNVSFTFQNEKFTCIPYIGAYQHQIKNSQIILHGDNKRHPLFVWCKIQNETIKKLSVEDASKTINDEKLSSTIKIMKFPDIENDYKPPLKNEEKKQLPVILYTKNIIKLPIGFKSEKQSIDNYIISKQPIKNKTVIHSYSPKYSIPNKPSKVCLSTNKKLPFKK